ncbi:MAG TPA: divalent-cation tolerance protein CutA [Bryobacteraceae bacterium]|jgi:periplasmic divalent cation tolerance protein|nr:divalent-cation tolerance protein CutA [Bryobacteraceae bacterium]
MTDKIVVFSTCETEEEAARVGRSLVEKGLAACVNILPGMRSIYRWKDAVEEASETLLIIKTGRPLVGAVEAEIERLHSYELPEVVALQIVDGSDRYLDWLAAGLKQTDAEPR